MRRIVNCFQYFNGPQNINMPPRPSIKLWECASNLLLIFLFFFQIVPLRWYALCKPRRPTEELKSEMMHCLLDSSDLCPSAHLLDHRDSPDAPTRRMTLVKGINVRPFFQRRARTACLARPWTNLGNVLTGRLFANVIFPPWRQLAPGRCRCFRWLGVVATDFTVVEVGIIWRPSNWNRRK